jgi:radical SAM protein
MIQAAPRAKPDFASIDFDQAPFIVIWEMTQACDLACVHCRAEAKPWRESGELSTEEAKRLLDQVREFGHPLMVLTGGDPLKRPDLFELIRYGDGLGLRMTLTPSGTKLMTRDVIQRMKDAGLARLAVSLDAPTGEAHDAFRKVSGSFDWTLAAIREARAIGLPVQINTTITRHNQDDVAAMAALMGSLDICLWSVFFLVPTGRGQRKTLVSARKHEEIFTLLYDLSKTMPYDIKTTSAQAYRRVVIQRRRAEGVATGRPPMGMEAGGWVAPSFLTGRSQAAADASTGVARSAKGINDGNGFVFISHLGEVCPSGFLPVSAGNVRKRSLVDLYRNAELFKSLRDYGRIKGKCGYCDYRDVCGGSRSRAYGLTGDVHASDPTCLYVPPKPATPVDPADEPELIEDE